MTTQYKSWTELPKGMRNVAVFPKIAAMMSGVSWAWQDHAGHVGLHYVDGTEESCIPSGAFELTQQDDPFTVVSFVQSHRASLARTEGE